MLSLGLDVPGLKFGAWLLLMVTTPGDTWDRYSFDGFLPNGTPYDITTNSPTYGSPGCLSVVLPQQNQCMSPRHMPDLTKGDCAKQKKSADGYTNMIGAVSNTCTKQTDPGQ